MFSGTAEPMVRSASPENASFFGLVDLLIWLTCERMESRVTQATEGRPLVLGGRRTPLRNGDGERKAAVGWGSRGDPRGADRKVAENSAPRPGTADHLPVGEGTHGTTATFWADPRAQTRKAPTGSPVHCTPNASSILGNNTLVQQAPQVIL